MAHRFLLFLRRARWRMLFSWCVDRFIRQTGGPSARSLGLLYFVPMYHYQRPVADSGFGSAAAFLAHADRVEHLSADVQILVAHVSRILGAFSIWNICLSSVFRSALEDDHLAWPSERKFRPPGMLGGVIAVIEGLFGFYVTGYIGVFLTV